MSNIGKKFIKLPKELFLKIEKKKVFLKGPLGEIILEIPGGLDVLVKNDFLFLKCENSKKTKIQWGTFRSHFYNSIIGVTQGFQVLLKLVGIGYRAIIEKDKLVLKLGFSHLIFLEIPKGIEIICKKPSLILLKGYDLLMLTQFAALIRSYKIPEPYKGKGILYKGEKIRRKEGKKK
jgi:large subunit ribosomal protein L6